MDLICLSMWFFTTKSSLNDLTVDGTLNTTNQPNLFTFEINVANGEIAVKSCIIFCCLSHIIVQSPRIDLWHVVPLHSLR